MMVILGPLAALTTSAVTLTLASLAASLVTVPPSTTSSGVRSMLSPGAPATLSISRTSPTDTFSWRPPARTIAYTGHSLSMVSETAHTLEPSRSSRGFAGHRSVGAPTHNRTGSPVPRPNQPLASPPAVTVRGGPAGATTRPRCRRGRDGGLLTGAAYAVSSSATCAWGGSGAACGSTSTCGASGADGSAASWADGSSSRSGSAVATASAWSSASVGSVTSVTSVASEDSVGSAASGSVTSSVTSSATSSATGACSVSSR